MNPTNRRLGKGLEALLGEGANQTIAEKTILQQPEGERVQEVALHRLDPNPFQPRQAFDEQSLQELSDSIRLHGILQPILVTRGQGGRYTIVAGERRWRAARKAGLVQVPVIVRQMDEQQLMEAALIENLQRTDLNPVEEAEAIQTLMQTYGFTQEAVSQRVGKSRSTVANALRLLSLPAGALQLVRDGQLSSGHARAVLMAPSAQQEAFAQQIVEKGLSVRQAERMAQALKSEREQASATPVRDVHLASAEATLRRALGTKVALTGSLSRGRITIEYFSQQDLERIYAMLGGEQESL